MRFCRNRYLLDFLTDLFYLKILSPQQDGTGGIMSLIVWGSFYDCVECID